MKQHGDRPASLAPLAVRTAASRIALSCLVIAAAVFTAAGSPDARAQSAKVYQDETAAADADIAGGKWQQALTALDQRIAAQPRDVQAQFKRATLLARLGRDDQAIAAFTQITQTYPELPEPYNNLAALYAKHGRLQEARATLETALSANPNFALARRNLGDVYLRLAADAYSRTARLTPGDTLAQTRLKGITLLLDQSRPMAPGMAAGASPTDAAPLSRAAAVNAHGYVPSMGGQPPLIVPDTADIDARMQANLAAARAQAASSASGAAAQ